MRRAVALAACALLGGCVAASGGALGQQEPASGYLAAATLDELAATATPPPLEDPAQARFDAVLPGSDRWWLAIVHAELRPPEAAQHFDCALNTRLAAAPRPALTRLMNRLLIDVSSLSERVARQGHRPRPIAAVPGLEPCQRTTEAIRAGSSWPATGALAGAAYGELFAALAPDRATQARATGREIGISRAVCRMNWGADVAAGGTLGRAVYVRASAAPDFAVDLAAARVEVAAARAEGLTNAGCAAERRALGIRPGAD